MPIQHAAFKALRQAQKSAKKNLNVRENIQYLVRQAKRAIQKKDSAQAKELILRAVKVIDKAVQRNIFKKNTGARNKSRLFSQLKKSLS